MIWKSGCPHLKPVPWLMIGMLKLSQNLQLMQPFRGDIPTDYENKYIVKVLKKTFQCDGTCFVEKRKFKKSYRTLLLMEQTLY